MLQVLLYTAQVCWTAYESISGHVCAAIQTSKNNSFCGGDLTGPDSQNDSCGGPQKHNFSAAVPQNTYLNFKCTAGGRDICFLQLITYKYFTELARTKEKKDASDCALLPLCNWSTHKRLRSFCPVLFLDDEHHEVSDCSFCRLCSAEQTFAAEEQGTLKPTQTHWVQQMHSGLQRAWFGLG